MASYLHRPGLPAALQPIRTMMDVTLEVIQQQLADEVEARYRGVLVLPTHDQGYTTTGHDFHVGLRECLEAIDRRLDQGE